MMAAGRKRAGQTVLVLAAGLCLAACGSVDGGAEPPPGPIDVSLIERSEPSANSERPAFFVQWSRSALAGLTQRPTIDKSTRLPEYPRAA